ncbi:MAG: magnesium transporter [Verrucomicrobiales bacterium]|nr:magnesium transporter [Verrucomicrobiales bacterium]|tara:strand:+ start:649 stop:1995 length:1347 start_codon:yes stop_codon:yes gene_type:complete
MSDQTPVYLEEYTSMHPADLADRLQRMDVAEARHILVELPLPQAADALAELEDDVTLHLLENIPNERLVPLLNEMDADEAADLLGELPAPDQHRLLGKMDTEQSEAAKELLSYPEDSAGGIMHDRYISLRAGQSVSNAQKELRKHEDPAPEDINYLYVTDPKDKLVGIVSLRDLVFAPPRSKVKDVMDSEVEFVRVDDDQEEVVRRFEHYHYLGLPVLDEHGTLMGVIKSDDVLTVAQEEATEDMQKMVGLSGEERTLTPWTQSFKRRLPWLLINLLTACLAGAVVGVFEGTIAEFAILAIFLPVIAGQGGNAGMQTTTVIIRDMALGELSPGDGRKALAKELALGLFNGVVIGLIVGGVALLVGLLFAGHTEAPFTGQPWMLGIVVGVAMMLNQLAAALFGVVIPYGLKFFRMDPALASSILITTVTDVAGFFFLLMLAKTLLTSTV